MVQLSHLNAQGQANMVDVTTKQETQRTAVAEGYIYMSGDALNAVTDQHNKKGDVLATARIAGIQAAKQTSNLIPLCHPLALTKVAIDLAPDPANGRIRIEAMCKLSGKTGVEMEALTACSVAALTLFDMCKAADPAMRIEGIRVLRKEGGKTGSWSV
ncbi:cyclic pyranopterin monophosphate synthase MoaC [Echinimonas agarilytica]|uniref:Cyclic pyranopterin monophosphate synthase n=1 Tax=Echinimonas agarilytica TaxID=1215918 RepID=A0AA42B9M3_9GAMM|nr:cyclic pyranopterin monophosphate synthase MoaC [Echinimonas agarilytica]MCM2681206.1 cyclic pyranopterin monophosphate synthase MoaC [Echinimonas agarilytica]